MLSLSRLAALFVALLAVNVSGQDQPDFDIKNLPYNWEPDQFGTNQCKQWQPSHPWSNCQNLFINHVRDFCLWAPHNPATIGDSERTVVSWCVKAGYGTRLIPDNTLTGAHFIKTPDFLQVTGYGNFNNMNIPWGDDGGELDPHGADGHGNPLGALVWSRNVMGREGQWVQIKEWSNFMSVDEFSIRACYGPNAARYCPHTLDEMGSRFNHPGNYDIGYFDSCHSASGPYPNVFNGKEFHQGDPYTPEAHKPAPRWGCKKPLPNIKMGIGARVTPYRRAYDLEEDEDDNLV